MLDAHDADVKATQPTLVVKLAAAVQALTGVFVGLSGLQLVGIVFYRHPILNALPWTLMISGVALIVIAARVFRARAWAAIAGVVIAPALALLLGFWAIYSFGDVFSCVLMLAIPLTLIATGLGALAIGPVRRATEARERLDAQGFNLGL